MVSLYVNYPKNSKMCTDTSWLCLFVTFWIILIGITASAILYGNYLPIINGYDSFGNICGVKLNARHENFSLSGTDTSTKPYVTFFADHDLSNAVKICIEQCTPKRIRFGLDLLIHSQQLKIQFCRYDFEMSNLKDKWQHGLMHRLGPCPASVYKKSVPIKNTCMSYSEELYSHLNYASVPQAFFVYVYLTWHYISVLSAFSLVISIVLLVTMHCLTKIISWLICFLTIIANIGLCALLWLVYRNLPIDQSSKYKYDFDTIEQEDEFYLYDEDVEIWYYLLKDFRINKNVIYVAVVFTSAATVVLLIIIILLRRQLTRLTLLFKEAGSCLAKLPGLMKIPLISLLVFLIYFSFSTYTMLCITTSSYLEVKPMTDNHNTKYAKKFKSFQQLEYTDVTFIHHSFYVYILGVIWTIEFIFACEEFTLGTVVANWSFGKSIHSPIRHVTASLLRYHLGTVAKGSIAIALFKVPRLIVTYLCRKINKNNVPSYSNRRKSKIGAIEKWLGALSGNAYPVVAMEAVDFFPAGVITWNRIQATTMEVEAINMAADFVLFLAKLFVATVTCIVAILLLRDKEDVLFYMAPVLLSTIIAFFIAHIVLSLYEIVINTLLSCFCGENEASGNGDRSMIGNLSKLFDRTGKTNRGHIHFIEVKPIKRQPSKSKSHNVNTE